MVGFLFNIVSKLRTLPFEWDSKLYEFKSVSKFRYRMCLILSLKIWSQLAFAILRSYQDIVGGVPKKLVFFGILEIVRLTLGAVLQFVNLYRPKEIIDSINHVLKFHVMLRSKSKF